MHSQCLDGKRVARERESTLRDRLKQEKAKGRRMPCLVVCQVGRHPASLVYIEHKKRAAERVGIHSRIQLFEAETPEEEVVSFLQTTCADPEVDGVLLQVPLPSGWNALALTSLIPADKDVDGFHPYNMGSLALRQPNIRSCTPMGIMHLLEAYQIAVRGKHAVVVGASNIVGRPMALELLHAGATVSICHRFTPYDQLRTLVGWADVLVVAVGQHGVVDPAWIKPGSVVVDVGVHRDAQGVLSGDLPTGSLEARTSHHTPVPGGVGPMTLCALMENCVQLWAQHLGLAPLRP